MPNKNLLANYVGQAWAALMGIAFVPLYIKYLGIEAYGLIGVFTILQTALTLLDAGISPTLSREMAQFTGGARSIKAIRNLLRSIEIVAILVASVIATSVWVAAPWLTRDWIGSGSTPPEEVAASIALMGIVCAFRFLEGVYRSAIVGLQKQVLLNIVGASMATFRGAGAVIAIMYAPTVATFFAWQILASASTVVILLIVTHRSIPAAPEGARFSSTALLSIWRFAGGMLLIAISSILLTQIDKILLARILPLSSFGYYTFASLVASSSYMIVFPVVQAWYPKLNELHGSGDTLRYNHAFHFPSQLVSVTLGSFSVILILFPEPLLNGWTHDHVLTENTASVLAIMALGNLLNGLMVVPYHAQLSQGWTGLRVKINFVLVFAFLPLIFIVAPLYGTVGVAWTWVAVNIVYLVAGTQLMFNRILSTEKWRWIVGDTLQPVLIAFGIGGIVHIAAPVGLVEGYPIPVIVVTFALVLLSSACAAPLIRRQLDFALSKLIGCKASSVS